MRPAAPPSGERHHHGDDGDHGRDRDSLTLGRLGKGARGALDVEPQDEGPAPRRSPRRRKPAVLGVGQLPGQARQADRSTAPRSAEGGPGCVQTERHAGLGSVGSRCRVRRPDGYLSRPRHGQQRLLDQRPRFQRSRLDDLRSEQFPPQRRRSRRPGPAHSAAAGAPTALICPAVHADIDIDPAQAGAHHRRTQRVAYN